MKPHYRATPDGPVFIGDGLSSMATRLGTEQDKATTVTYTVNLLNEQQLEAAYRTSWLMKKIVDLPALDATRKWRLWSGKRMQEVLDLEDAFRVKAKVYAAKWKARLYGGSVILIGCGNQDLNEPLDPATVRRGDLKYLTVLTRKDIMPGIMDIDPRSQRYGLPIDYQITTNTGEVLRVHPTRLVEFIGEPLPAVHVGGAQSYGWGDSVLQSVYTSCLHTDSTMANIASLVFDAKTDVINMPGLSDNIMDPVYEEALIRRFTTARMLKGNNGILLLDGDETYTSKSFTFSGLSDVADRFMQICAGAADIPATRLFGMSPAGMNATGESDLNNYHEVIEVVQKLDLEPAMTILDAVLIRSALGDMPDDLTYTWKPLKQMTEEQISGIRNKDAQTLKTLQDAGIYAPEEIAAAGAQMFQETGIDSLTVSVDAGEDEDEDLGPEPEEENDDDV